MEKTKLQINLELTFSELLDLSDAINIKIELLEERLESSNYTDRFKNILNKELLNCKEIKQQIKEMI